MEFRIQSAITTPDHIQFLHEDQSLALCIKPQGVASTDVPGGLPERIRMALGDPKATVRTVHRLDQVVGGLMVVARSRSSASELGRQFREDLVKKTYLAVVHGSFPEDRLAGTLEDLLIRNKEERKTYVTTMAGKDAQPARLHYRQLATVGTRDPLSLVEVHLETGRTHQIRCQLSSRGLPIAGDRKYSLLEDSTPIALWSTRLVLEHPFYKEQVVAVALPPDMEPWCRFSDVLGNLTFAVPCP